MRRIFGVVGLLAIVTVLALGTGTPSRAGVPYTKMVEPNGMNCGPTPTTVYTTIHEAITAATDNDTIFVCSGTYPEPTMGIIANNLSLIGPGSTLVADGTATMVAAATGFGDTFFFVDGDNVTISGLTMDLTPPTGNPLTTAIGMNHQVSATISDNVITHATSNAIYIQDQTKTGTYHINNNHITSSFRGLYCECDNADVQGNTIVSSSPDGITAIYATGDNGTVSGNMVTAGFIDTFGSNWTVSNNTIDGNQLENSGFQAGYGTNLTLSGNHLIETSENSHSIQIVGSASVNTVVTVTKNTFESVPLGIVLLDNNPADAFLLNVTIGGSPADANVFTNSPTLDNDLGLLYLLNTTSNVNAEYNDWGRCSLEDIELGIYHLPDQAGRGTVDYDPFISPASCPTQAWGNLDCDDFLAGLDVVKLLQYLVELEYQVTSPCPFIGNTAEFTVLAESHIWGDLDCSSAVNTTDVMALLAYLGGVPYENAGDCPDIGAFITVAVG